MLSGKSLWNDCITCSSTSEFIDLISKAAKVKIDIVEKDNIERGNQRFSLNMGHTIAHAIEYYDDHNIIINTLNLICLRVNNKQYINSGKKIYLLYGDNLDLYFTFAFTKTVFNY